MEAYATLRTGQIVVRASGGDQAVIDGHQRAAHISHAPANRTYQSTLVSQPAQRVPRQPLSGWAEGYSAQWGNLPGALFMYG